MAKEEKMTKKLLPGVSATTYEECANREGRLFSEMVERVDNEEDMSDLVGKFTSEKGPVEMSFIALRDFYAGTVGSPPFAPRFKNFCEEGCKHSLCEYHSKK